VPVNRLVDFSCERPPAWPEALSPARLDALGQPTPFLACEAASIENRYRELRHLLPEVELFYAVKCNPAAEILGTLSRLGAGFEIASFYELEMVEAAGARPEEVIYSNTVKPPGHIAAAHSAGMFRFAFDSEPELLKLAREAPSSSVYARIAVDDGQSLFPLSKKFGTSAEEALRLLQSAAELGLVPYGVTFHVGSQCIDPQAWGKAIARCGTLMQQLQRRGIRLEMLDLGGGMPARYVDPTPSLGDIAGVIRGALERLPYRPGLIAAEPGRALVAESAVLVATVIGVERRGRERWAYLDVGGYNGMMEAVQTAGRWQFPLLTSRADHFDAPSVPTTVTGPSCDSSDTMFYDAPLPASLETGDRLYIGTAGAYTISYASHFNGFPPPHVVFVDSAERLARDPLVGLRRGA
jgi:ornithine decarboxylase